MYRAPKASGLLEQIPHIKSTEWITHRPSSSQTREEEYILESRVDAPAVGLRFLGTPDKADIIEVIEPNSSNIVDRMSALRFVARVGLPAFLKLTPYPGISDSPAQIEELVQLAVECNAEEIFVEPVNSRGPGLRLCQEALELWGYDNEAMAIQQIRSNLGWSQYVTELIKNTQDAVRRYSSIDKLRFLLYPKQMQESDRKFIEKDAQGIIWL